MVLLGSRAVLHLIDGNHKILNSKSHTHWNSTDDYGINMKTMEIVPTMERKEFSTHQGTSHLFNH